MTTRISILGGGFGGLYTALELSQRPWPTPPQITLVDRQASFLFTPLLYELLTGEMAPWEIAPAFGDVLKDTGITFCRADVTAIGLANQSVTLAPITDDSSQTPEPLTLDPLTLDYDYLVLALGGEPKLDQVPGAADHALPFRDLDDAARLKAKIEHWETLPGPVTVAIAGAGPSGVELACKLADRLPATTQILLLDRGTDILRGFTDASRDAAWAALRARQVTVRLQTEVKEVRADALDLVSLDEPSPTSPPVNGQTIPVAGVIWTVGTTMAPVIRALEVPRGDGGRVRIDPTLQVQAHPTVFALGDLATGVDASGVPIPATAQAAFQQASYCAWNVWAAANADETYPPRPLLPFRYWALGEMLSLGTDASSVAGLGLTLTGPLGYLSRRLVYLMRFPTLDHQLKVGWHWVTNPLWQEVQRWLPSEAPRS